LFELTLAQKNRHLIPPMIALGTIPPLVEHVHSRAIKHTVETPGSTVKRRSGRCARFATDSEVRRADWAWGVSLTTRRR
jgi:hypothetical protein